MKSSNSDIFNQPLSEEPSEFYVNSDSNYDVKPEEINYENLPSILSDLSPPMIKKPLAKQIAGDSSLDDDNLDDLSDASFDDSSNNEINNNSVVLSQPVETRVNTNDIANAVEDLVKKLKPMDEAVNNIIEIVQALTDEQYLQFEDILANNIMQATDNNGNSLFKDVVDAKKFINNIRSKKSSKYKLIKHQPVLDKVVKQSVNIKKSITPMLARDVKYKGMSNKFYNE